MHHQAPIPQSGFSRNTFLIDADVEIYDSRPLSRPSLSFIRTFRAGISATSGIKAQNAAGRSAHAATRDDHPDARDERRRTDRRTENRFSVTRTKKFTTCKTGTPLIRQMARCRLLLLSISPPSPFPSRPKWRKATCARISG
jgi:hypothetical protein